MPPQPKRVKISEQEVTGDHRGSARELVPIEKRPPSEHQMPKGDNESIMPNTRT